MPYLLLRISAIFVFLVFFATDLTAQKRSKKRPAHPRNSAPHTSTAANQKDAPVIDIRDPEPANVPIPQESTLTPKHKKTKKVIIVPAPPPPPGRDHVPPYPKR